MRSPRYTYARDLTGPWLLYDNEKDPLQLQNLVGNPEYAELQSAQDALLKRKLAEQSDDFLPAADYISKWGYKVDAHGTVPYAP